MIPFVSGEWKWIDNSVVDFTNWKSDMPKSDTCVEISSETGLWSTVSCSRYKSFICKLAKGRLSYRSCNAVLKSVTHINI